MKKLSGDLKSPFWIYGKAVLFLVIAVVATTLIIVETKSLKIGLLLALVVWAFCRLYYFAFYVIENYVDSNFKFASITGFFVYLFGRRKN